MASQQETATQEKTETFVIIGVHYWGRGKTLDEAKANFRREGGQLSKGYMILTFDPDTEFLGVDSMGYYEWKGNPPTKQMVAARTRKA